MEILTSTILIHKQVNWMKNRFIQIEQILSEKMLENNLGFLDFVKYKLDNANANHTFA